MEKIVCELMKADDPHDPGTHRRIASLMGTKTKTVETWANRFKDALEQISMVRNQMSRMIHPENREQLELQARQLLCPLPTAAEWKQADARSLAAQFGTSEDRTEYAEPLDVVLSEVESMPAIEKARLQEGASNRNTVAYQHLANQVRFKHARP